MKPFLLLLLFSFFVSFSNAQWINSFTLIPSNPTNLSQIKILANISFPSASCNDHTKSLFVSGSNIYASALHCLGPLTVICNYTDTFSIGQLAAGNYNFVLNINHGGWPSPCTPGIVPGPTDSLSFVVSVATAVNELNELKPNIIYDRNNRQIVITALVSMQKAQIQLLSLDGKLQKTFSGNSGKLQLDVSEMNSGMYLIRIRNGAQDFSQKILLQD
jgi:hypothetical protein